MPVASVQFRRSSAHIAMRDHATSRSRRLLAVGATVNLSDPPYPAPQLGYQPDEREAEGWLVNKFGHDPDLKNYSSRLA